MSKTTNLQLNKHDNVSTNENPFDIENYLNANWDIIDTSIGNLETNKVDKVEGKGLSTNDYSNEEKQQVSTNKTDISNIKDDIAEIDQNISTIEQDIDTLGQKTDSNSNKIATLTNESGATIELLMNSSNYILTANLKNKAGTIVSTTNIDLPLESLVKDIQYDSTTKEIIFILENGTTRRVPIGDLISGLQKEITPQNKLSSDLVDDINSTHKFVTANEKAQITGLNTKTNQLGEQINETQQGLVITNQAVASINTHLENTDTEINDLQYHTELIDSNLVALDKNYEMGTVKADGTEEENTDGTRWRTPASEAYSVTNIEYIDIPANYYVWIFYYINGTFSSRKGVYTNQKVVPQKPASNPTIRLVVAKGSGYTGVLTLDEIKKKIKVVTKSDLENRVETLEKDVPDLQTRVGQIEDDISEYKTVPTYWRDYLDEKYETLNNLDANIANAGDSFIFITDVHIDGNNMKSPLLIKDILKNTSTNKVVCGGDILTSYATQQEAINKLAEWRNSFDLSDTLMMTILGNHDTNKEGNSKNTEAQLNAKMFFGLSLKKYENDITNLRNYSYSEGCYYDNESEKIRYIYLLSGNSAAAVIGDGQINYMKARINELSSDWSVIVFTHMFFSPSTTSTVNVNTNGRKIMAGLDEIYDTTAPTIIGVITGHIHRDYSITSDKGYPIITTTCDASGTYASTYDLNYPTRTAGTTTEQAFDVFHIDKTNRKIYATRVGAGIDREFDY